MKPNFKNFNQLKDDDCNVDLHIHTNQTDGNESIETIINLAVKKGLKCIAFTEHVRVSTDWFSEFANNVRTAASCYPQIEVLLGAESKVVNFRGDLDITVDILNKCDIVLGSVHRIPDGKGGSIKFSEIPPKELAEIEFELARGMLKHAPIDVLAHPGGTYSINYRGFPNKYYKELMSYAKTNDKAIEFSSKYLHNPYDFLCLCSEVNPKISIGSDVHRAEELGNCREMMTNFRYRDFQRRG